MLSKYASNLSPAVTLHLRQSGKNSGLAGTTFASQSHWAASLAQPLQFACNTGLTTVEGLDPASSTFVNVVHAASIMFVDGVTDLYVRKRKGTEVPPVLHGGADPTVIAKIESYVAAARKANATVVLDANYDDNYDQEEKDTLWLAGMYRSVVHCLKSNSRGCDLGCSSAPPYVPSRFGS